MPPTHQGILTKEDSLDPSPTLSVRHCPLHKDMGEGLGLWELPLGPGDRWGGQGPWRGRALARAVSCPRLQTHWGNGGEWRSWWDTSWPHGSRTVLSRDSETSPCKQPPHAATGRGSGCPSPYLVTNGQCSWMVAADLPRGSPWVILRADSPGTSWESKPRDRPRPSSLALLPLVCPALSGKVSG